MHTRKGTFALAGVLALAAAAAWAGPGSVISSFHRFLGDRPTAVYRDADYVYVVNLGEGLSNYAIKYTPTGSYVGISTLWFCRYVPEDVDHSFLGSSYITLAVERGLVTYLKEGGTPVRWDHNDLRETIGYAHRPGSQYYFVCVWPESRDYDHIVYAFKTGGSLVSTFIPAEGGWLGATDRFAGLGGEYLIIHGGTGTCDIYDPGGSLVATFGHEAGCGIRGGTAGPGYPASWGTTLWVLGSWGHNDHAVFQIDLGNGTPSAIVPTSLGKVKALFR
ncbi:MAG: hypothetical protein JSU81_07340 [Candidatus Coatesbacteria bacterium]|nr:MAG: hypothetical protein JSU81_07340 [Candidatus Coatesbacteria bacterium]